MGESLPKPGLTDAAWVKIDTQLDAQTLISFCHNLERLYRLNPYLSIEHWAMPTQNSIQAKWINSSNHAEFTLQQEIQVTFQPNEIRLHYSSGLKKETYLIVEPLQHGSSLTVIDDYNTESERGHENHVRLEVDKSLHAWGTSLKSFLRHYVYLRKIPGIEFVIDRFWIRLSPMARRIVYLLMVITAFELLLLLIFVALWILV